MSADPRDPAPATVVVKAARPEVLPDAPLNPPVTLASTYVAGAAIQIVAGRRAGMGTVIGLGAAGDGAGIIVGGVAAGAFAGWLGTQAAFFFGACALGTGVALLAWLLRPLAPSEVNASAPEEAALSAG